MQKTKNHNAKSKITLDFYNLLNLRLAERLGRGALIFVFTWQMMPVDAHKFRAELTYFYLEDENGCAPRAYEHTHGCVPLAASVQDGVLILDGVVSPYKPQAFDLRFSNHSYGMLFQVNCHNQCEHVKEKIVWRRAVNREFMRTFFQTRLANEMVMHLQGDAPEVARCPATEAVLTVSKKGHDFHLHHFRLAIPLAVYDLFIERYSQ